MLSSNHLGHLAWRRGIANISRRTRLLVLAIIAGVLGIGGVAYATIPAADGVIHGCYNASANPSGALRVIDAEAGAACNKNEKALNFNQTGPQGQQGIQGIQGIQGLPGLAGKNGIDGKDGVDGKDGAAGFSDAYRTRWEDAIDIGSNTSSAVILGLPPGNFVVTATTVLSNGDSDAQDADCTLSTGATIATRLGGASGDFTGSGPAQHASVTVQDILSLGTNNIVSIRCHTFRGLMRHTTIIAVKVNELHYQ